jgi:hypothetical protein
MDKLITDSARVEISKQIVDILRSLCIDAWQSEPHYQHQNFAEHRWKAFKRNVDWFMNWEMSWIRMATTSEWIADVITPLRVP